MMPATLSPALMRVHSAVLKADMANAPKLIMMLLVNRADPDTCQVYIGRRQLAAVSGLSPTAVYGWLRRLRDAGWLEQLPPASRACGWRLKIP